MLNTEQQGSLSEAERELLPRAEGGKYDARVAMTECILLVRKHADALEQRQAESNFAKIREISKELEQLALDIDLFAAVLNG